MSMLLLLFEVMGEMPSLSVLWGFFLIFGVGGFLLVRLHPAFLIPILLVVLMYSFLLIDDINDVQLGPQIIREAGYSYIAQVYSTIVIGPTILSSLGVIAWLWRRNNNKQMV